MSHVKVAPDVVAAAVADLETLADTVEAAHLATAPRTLAVTPAAADEVSVNIAHLFSGHAEDYFATAGQAAAFQQNFAQTLSASAVSYANAESVNGALLQGFEALFQQGQNAILNALAAYLVWSESWISFVPGPLRTYVYAPILLALLAALGNALFAAIVLQAIGMIPG